MKNRIKRIKRANKIALIALLGLAITNPWSVGYIGAGIDTAVVYFTLYANYVFVIGLVLLAVVNIYMMYAGREKINIPKKSAKTKTAKYLEI